MTAAAHLLARRGRGSERRRVMVGKQGMAARGGAGRASSGGSGDRAWGLAVGRRSCPSEKKQHAREGIGTSELSFLFLFC